MTMKRVSAPVLALSAAALLAGTCLGAATAQAMDATWLAAPGQDEKGINHEPDNCIDDRRALPRRLGGDGRRSAGQGAAAGRGE